MIFDVQSGYVSIKDNQDVEVWVTPRQEPRESQIPYDPDFELGKPFCFHGTKAVKQDCLDAYNQFPVDEQGHLINPETKSLANSLHLKFKSCSITVYTTDGTNVLVKKQDSLDVVNTMMNTCDSQWGIVNIKGAEGPNGHVTITSRSTTTSHSS
ncbi:uncharacterized protein PGTG_16710 [Puccinia graminis f. sp. tritici CRL 75-36-700-3]|uniref:Uncharacterized protein n=1 Tax=Puccinia graminis f. sp. tritici (strain CRL 75-36-700-3 / race SCCL) TaxID=418459 RepID=E3L2G9_PUCGT|nr:uncharacterized protein PGTG_16710 [Puccinia graminis f. sp. tritici CRL 75-36-700-3]EFP90684.2 hypothetical protein PGTG_16710 [Puccinia graminis f. sp. tritici CRL 75-36-700-3]